MSNEMLVKPTHSPNNIHRYSISFTTSLVFGLLEIDILTSFHGLTLEAEGEFRGHMTQERANLSGTQLHLETSFKPVLPGYSMASLS